MGEGKLNIHLIPPRQSLTPSVFSLSQHSHLAVALPDSPNQVEKERLPLQGNQVAVKEARAALDRLALALQGGSLWQSQGLLQEDLGVQGHL